jgi:integrase
MRARQDWRGSVHRDKNGLLSLRVKGLNGKWTTRGTGLPDTEANRAKAAALLATVRAQLKIREAVLKADDDDDGPVTVAAYYRRWLPTRKGPDFANDESRMRLHVLPLIGDLELEDVRPRQILEIVNASKAAGLAPRTIRNVYGLLKAFFRDAIMDELLATGASPCILTTRHTGKVRDAVAGWRDTAVFSREELEQLLWNESIPQPRRVLYALLSVGCLRLGEAAGLRWERVDLGYDTLGRMSVTTSYDNGKTKTATSRYMPVHPSAKSLLNEWKLGGWARTFGRVPVSTDLVVPTPPEAPRKGRRRAAGSMLDDAWVWKRLQKDVEALGFPRRRTHDLRRTGISLYIEDGADENILRRGTHAAPMHVMGIYTSVHWKTLCREVSKLRFARRPTSSAASLLASGKNFSEYSEETVEAAGIEPAALRVVLGHVTSVAASRRQSGIVRRLTGWGRETASGSPRD